MTAGRMLMERPAVSTVAEALHLSTATVKRYKAVLEDGGLAGLKQMSVGGCAPALDAAALEWIAAALHGSAESTVSQATHGPTRGYGN